MECRAEQHLRRRKVFNPDDDIEPLHGESGFRISARGARGGKQPIDKRIETRQPQLHLRRREATGWPLP